MNIFDVIQIAGNGYLDANTKAGSNPHPCTMALAVSLAFPQTKALTKKAFSSAG